jgi:hypothetical protein
LLERVRSDATAHINSQDEALAAISRKHEADMKAREEEIRLLNSELAQLRTRLAGAERGQKDAEKTLLDHGKRYKDVMDTFEVQCAAV